MKKSFFVIILMCVLFVSCNNSNKTNIETITIEDIEYVDTFNVEYIATMYGHSLELVSTVDLKEINDKQVIIKYSSSDLVLHISYDGKEYLKHNMAYYSNESIDSNGEKYNEVYFTNILEENKHEWTLKCDRYENGKEKIYMVK